MSELFDPMNDSPDEEGAGLSSDGPLANGAEPIGLGQRQTRRRVIQGAAVGVAAAGAVYLKPSFHSFTVPVAIAGSQAPTPTDTPRPENTPTNTPRPTDTPTNTSVPTNTPTNTSTLTATPTNTSVPTNTPTNTATNTPTNTATRTSTPTNTATNTPTVNYCLDVLSPGYWKGHAMHYSDAQFYAMLKSTIDFGATFSALTQSAAISLADTILGLMGSHVVRSLLSAELNVVAVPALGLQTYSTFSGTINQRLTMIYNDNGAGNSSPYTNGSGLTSGDMSVIGFLGTDQTATSPCPIA